MEVCYKTLLVKIKHDSLRSQILNVCEETSKTTKDKISGHLLMGVFDKMQELRLYRQQKKNIFEAFKADVRSKEQISNGKNSQTSKKC